MSALLYIYNTLHRHELVINMRIAAILARLDVLYITTYTLFLSNVSPKTFVDHQHCMWFIVVCVSFESFCQMVLFVVSVCVSTFGRKREMWEMDSFNDTEFQLNITTTGFANCIMLGIIDYRLHWKLKIYKQEWFYFFIVPNKFSRKFNENVSSGENLSTAATELVMNFIHLSISSTGTVSHSANRFMIINVNRVSYDEKIIPPKIMYPT